MSVDRGADTIRNDPAAGKLADIVAFPGRCAAEHQAGGEGCSSS
jgi:hypothetical protein